ncbi:hypothetical protein EJD97_022798 [Solanum chilense]|uniref:Uncharacterized protein n=1 Tax=Solanum chilense TaxID=4083 RepID=A0A6N2CB54_SOLCI|nr:hypothetical protein EJD97_022798 [Solanum chilense]
MSAATISAATTSVAHNLSTAALMSTEKLANFYGVELKRWKQNMLFYITTLSLQSNVKTSKELCDALEKKYKTEDAGMKKFIVAKFLNYKMIDSKTVITQVQELHVIIHDLLAEGLIVNDACQVLAIIEKLPPLWKDFKNYLKYKRKEMTIEDLIVRSRIEQDIKVVEKRSRDIQWKLFNCEKRGHKATECWGPKKDKKENDKKNLVEYKGEMDDLCAMISESPTDQKLLMASSVVAKVEGTDKVLLKMTSGKVQF